jgi:hypothetical protein
VTADLAQSCADIGRWLPVAQALITEPDQDGTATGGQPGTRPPWNPSAASAYLDALEGLRRLEASLRLAVTGHPGPRRGGSGANTAQAIAAIENLGQAVTVAAVVQAVRLLDGWSRQIQQLPAVDEAERWLRVSGAECPYCHVRMLRLSPRAGRVTCIRHGWCFDADGRHPVGYAGTSMSGDPMVTWADGLLQYGTAGEVPAP